jgi:hypothetical protein
VSCDAYLIHELVVVWVAIHADGNAKVHARTDRSVNALEALQMMRKR